jgi:hypothetical protein
MKTKVLLFIMYLLFINGTALVCAQRPDSTIIREGDIVYIYKDGFLEKFGQKELKGKSYETVSFESSSARTKQIYKPLYRSVFPKERAEELSYGTLSCIVDYSPVENKILKIRFIVKDIPVTLKELDELERKLRTTPDVLKFSHWGEIVDHGERITFPIRFKDLYK